MSNYLDTKKRMKLFRYFTIFHQAHSDVVNKMNGFVYDNINKFDEIEQKRILDIMRRIDELGRLYNVQITEVAKLIDDSKREWTEEQIRESFQDYNET